jgi:hypothetical protein
MRPAINKAAILSRMRESTLRYSAVLLVVLGLAGWAMAGSGDAVASVASESSPAIVIGFVGGFVHPDDMRHAEVQLADKLSTMYAGRIHAQVFDNHHRQDAYRAIYRWLDADGDGQLSDSERRASRIVLYGHSWGATTVLTLARELQREDIPVLLTVQVDSIKKIGEDDRIVPANVAEAINFYQSRGWLHGHPEISAADPTRTEILGQFGFDYPKMPSECHNYPWLDRHVFKGHTSIECDPNVWLRVSDLIHSVLTARQAKEAALR